MCSQHAKVVDCDLNLEPIAAARRKIAEFSKRPDFSHCIFVRRFGRPQLMKRCSSKILRSYGAPFLNLLCLEDKPENLSKYLEAYAAQPGDFIFGPRGANCIANFASEASCGIITHGGLIHIMDDNIRSFSVRRQPKNDLVPLGRMGGLAVPACYKVGRGDSCGGGDKGSLG